MCNEAQKFPFAFKSSLNNFFVIICSLLSWFGAIIIEFCLSQWNDPFHITLPSVHVKNVFLFIILFWREPLSD